MATASTSTCSFDNVSAALFAQPSGRSPIACGCCRACGSTTTRSTVDFDQQVYGGLQTTDPALIALQRSIFAPQAYQADVDDDNVSGQLTAAYASAHASTPTRPCDGLQVGRPQSQWPAHRCAESADPGGGDRQARRCPARRGRSQDRATSGRHRQPDGVPDRHQGLPGAGRQRRRRRAAWLSRQRREGPRPRRRTRQHGATSDAT